MESFADLFSTCLSKGSSIVLERLELPMKASILAEAFKLSKKNILLLSGEGQEQSQLFQEISFFLKGSIIELPSWETLPTEHVPPSKDIIGARQKAFHAIVHRKKPVFVLSSLQASLQRTLQASTLKKEMMRLKKGEKIGFETLISRLQTFGYERRPLVTEKGEFSVRGGIIDLFPVTEAKPLRVEFWENEIDSLRLFDLASQKSDEKIDSIEISSARELESLEAEETLSSVFQLLGDDTLIVMDDLELLEDRYASLVSQGGTKSKIFMGVEEWLDELEKKQILYLTYQPLESLSEVKRQKSKVQFSLFQRELSGERLHHPFISLPCFYEDKCLLSDLPEGESLISCLIETQESCPTTIAYQSQVELEWLKHKITDLQGSISSKTTFKEGYLSSGFARLDTGEVYFSIPALTGRVHVRRDVQRISSLITGYDAFDLEPGDHVVHFNHGLGKFFGIDKRKDIHGAEQEFFIIDYAEGGRLWVPLHQAHLISKYIGGKEEVPKLHVLGTTRWKKLREETEKAIIGYASDLLKAQAERVFQGGHSFPEDSQNFRLFEAEFPYTETADQVKAIQDIKQDMCSSKAMDRLVCGDVGYGKTEVAMRAACKAVLDGKKQVAVLVPTTVLAMQHYENFLERMSPFGVRVGVLSRFNTPSQNREIIEKVQHGDLDIIIGTHRLVQKDVSFFDLGLIVIDEEQRFGVKAKEHLKILKKGVDCLTLSATPIPRTLYMSIIGARELSTIATPPHDRLPIKTIVTEPSDSLIQTALLRELNRGGQVFFIHNRVESIFERATYLKKLLPHAKIVTAHGQQDSDDLDQVFHSFKKGDVDILVSTTIVENGIDIPNANTLIVDRADQFGVADLYQLRGRVGRWNRRAYAYFLVPQNKVLSEVAKKRIEAIAQAGGYGGGLRVAMRDLEIRGAGDILGTEQSGHVASIGFHLYCKLLKRTIETLQGKTPSWTLETRVETSFDARLPEYYVNEISLRMEFYQRLGDARSQEEVASIQEELKDRFGPLPEQARWLTALSRVRIAAAHHGITLVKLENVSIIFEKKHGQKTSSNRVLVSKITTPDDFEKKVLGILGKS